MTRQARVDSGPTNTNTVHLSSIENLFAAPSPDPWRGHFDTRNGMELLRDMLTPAGAPVEVYFAVPARAPRDIRDIRDAVHAYCEVEIARLDRERARVARLGRRELLFGTIFLAVCLALAAAIGVSGVTTDWFGQFLAEGLVIIGWIALWHPVDMLFFDRLPLVRDQRVLKRIRDGRINLSEPVVHE